MQKMIWLASAMMGLSACASSDVLTVYSDPSGALVRISGFGECETPCDIKIATTTDITVAKAGYLPKRLRINPGDGDVKVKLELAAPTEDVDVETLPSID